MRFQDRRHAGQLLAARLEHHRARSPVVLGLTRGGIPVAFEVARALGAPLDLIVVRKLSAAESPDEVVGAIAEGGATFLIPATTREVGPRREEAAALAERGVAELARRVRLYRDEMPAPHLAGREVIVVDDFVETGATARAAARAARQRGATRVALAVPAVAAGSEGELRREFDEVVSLATVPPGELLTGRYERLEAVSDEAAIALLHDARAARGALAEERAAP
jgi:predicted phosphoribosyltransferase